MNGTLPGINTNATVLWRDDYGADRTESCVYSVATQQHSILNTDT